MKELQELKEEVERYREHNRWETSHAEAHISCSVTPWILKLISCIEALEERLKNEENHIHIEHARF